MRRACCKMGSRMISRRDGWLPLLCQWASDVLLWHTRRQVLLAWVSGSRLAFVSIADGVF